MQLYLQNNETGGAGIGEKKHAPSINGLNNANVRAYFVASPSFVLSLLIFVNLPEISEKLLFWPLGKSELFVVAAKRQCWYLPTLANCFWNFIGLWHEPNFSMRMQDLLY